MYIGTCWSLTSPYITVRLPFMTLQILFAPAANARGHPGVSLRTNAIGAVILPAVLEWTSSVEDGQQSAIAGALGAASATA